MIEEGGFVMKNVLYWDKLQCEVGLLYVAATVDGLSYIGGPHESYEQLEKWAVKYFSTYTLVHNNAELLIYTQEIEAYFSGDLQQFTIPLDLRGTPFQLTVWGELQNIPYGETVYYAYIAEKISKLSATRAVGRAIGANPIMVVIPCHRVIGKNGKLTGFRGGLEMKRHLLTLEQCIEKA